VEKKAQWFVAIAILVVAMVFAAATTRAQPPCSSSCQVYGCDTSGGGDLDVVNWYAGYWGGRCHYEDINGDEWEMVPM